MIRNIVFDIGNVLIGFDRHKYLSGLFGEETGGRVNRAIFGSGYWPELDRAVMSEEEILEHFYEADPGIKDEIRTAFDRIGECVERLDWPIPYIEELRAEGYRVWYLSNMSEHVIGSNPGAYDFTSHMDGGVYSYEVKLIKPDPEIYTCLLNKYGLKAGECIFIDDHRENTDMAKKLGMKAIQYKDHEQLKADLGKALTKDRGHDRISVVCYGDSNTYGYDPSTGSRYPYEMRWTSILAEKLGPGYEVIPEGLNGRTTAYDRPGAGWKNGVSSFIACLGTHKPADYLVIMLGTNDCLAGLGLTAEDIAGGMETLVRIAEETSPGLQGYVPEIIVAVPAALGEDYRNSPFGFELNEASFQNSRDIAKLYGKIAADHGCLLADASLSAEVSALDSMHLSPRGHEQMAELIFRAIREGGASDVSF